MSEAKKPDWTRTGTVAGYAEYLRKSSDALCVVVIRPFNSVLAADPALTPADCGKRLAEELPGLVAELVLARAEKKKAALDAVDLELGQWSVGGIGLGDVTVKR